MSIAKPTDVYTAISAVLNPLGVATTKRGKDGRFCNVAPPFIAFRPHRADAREAGSQLNGITSITFEWEVMISARDEDEVVDVYASIAAVLQDQVGYDWQLKELTYSDESGSEASPTASATAIILVPIELSRPDDFVRGRPDSIQLHGLNPDPIHVTT